jgi:hypothetical protein
MARIRVGNEVSLSGEDFIQYALLRFPHKFKTREEVIEAHPMTSREHTGRRSNNPELLNTSGFFYKINE